MGLPELAAAMDREASAAWSWLTLVRGYRDFPGRLGEVTLTEFLQAQLWDEWTGQVLYKVPDEPITGADWEWYVGFAEENLWICIRVQAKILSKNLTFGSIGHKVGGRRQMDVLIGAAENNSCKTLSYYVFYVSDVPSSQGSTGLHLPLYGWDGMPTKTSREHFGCTAVNAAKVRDAYDLGSGRKSQPKTYLPYGFPWSELLRAFVHWTAAPEVAAVIDDERARLRRLLQILNGTATASSQELSVLQLHPLLREWTPAEAPQRRRSGSLPTYASMELEVARAQAREYLRHKEDRLEPASSRPEEPEASSALDETEQSPQPAVSETRAVIRYERPLGAPRFGLSFMDLDTNEEREE